MPTYAEIQDQIKQLQAQAEAVLFAAVLATTQP